MEKQEKKEKQELDLIDIFLAIFKFIGFILIKIKDFFIWLFRSMYRGKWILLIFILLGILFSFYCSQPERLRYKGEVEMRINTQDIYLYKEMIDMLNQYCADTSRTSLSQTLNMPVDEARRVFALNSYFYIDMLMNGTPDEVDYTNSFDPTDTLNTRMGDRLMLVVTAKDTAIYPLLLEKLKGFFATNSIVMKDNMLRLKQIDERIENINYEIRMLDSLRKIEYFKKEDEKQGRFENAILLNEKERRLYHNDILSLEASKQSLQWEKEVRPENVRFVTEFKVDPKPENRVTRSIKKYVPAFFILGIFFVLGWQSRKKIYRTISVKR